MSPQRPFFNQRLRFVASGLFVALASSFALAQTYPTKPVTLVVTYPPGGGADTMARLIAPKLGEALGQNIVIENRGGATGQIGAAHVAKSAPDGYTLMLDASAFSINPALYPKLPYDSEKAFRPIGLIALFPNVVLANPNFPAKTVMDAIALAKQRKDAVSYASSGNGSSQHLAGALFEVSAGVEIVHVPYKGGGPALIDVMGGQVPLLFGNLAATMQHIQSGKLRALAVTSAKRVPILPDTPTISESGVAGYEVYEWNAVFAPAGTPEAIVEKISVALKKALDTPEVKQRIAQLGGELKPTPPAETQKFISEQAATWAKLVKAKNIKLD
jgi:tripartite-type tricarboxylate transporter receptor subunit TctC